VLSALASPFGINVDQRIEIRVELRHALEVILHQLRNAHLIVEESDVLVGERELMPRCHQSRLTAGTQPPLRIHQRAKNPITPAAGFGALFAPGAR
jgi:hypothetical protein